MDPTYRALLIGNSTFPSDPHNLQALEGPVNDIALLRDALTDPVTGLFDQHRVRLVPERTMAELLVELDAFFGDASRDDRLLLYYSGHGLLTPTNELLLAARDTRTDRLRSTTVGAGAIGAMIEASPARTTMIVLDCCYSGAFKGGGLSASLRGDGRYVITSARSGELANDADRVNGTSLFTQHLVDAIATAAPDGDGDGFVRLGEVYDHVHARLAAEGRQIPQRSFSGGGDVAIARRAPARTLPGPPPPAPEAPPVLDLSETVIDLRDVAPGDDLPDEWIAVVNRGGGRLEWSADTDADWLDVQPGDGGFRLRLHPRPGSNRANVLVRDRVGGASKTVRVRVEVVAHADRSSGDPVPSPPPGPAPPPPGPVAPRPGPVVPPPPPVPWWRRPTAVGLAGAVVVVAAMVAFLAFTLPGGDGGGSEDGETVAVVVDGTAAWTDTGIDLGAGDQVEITATGEVFHNEADSVGPEGFQNRPELLTPVPDLPHAALLGRVGEDGEPFYVGSAASVTADRDGRLHLGINDGGLENNRGTFEAEVTIRRAAGDG